MESLSLLEIIDQIKVSKESPEIILKISSFQMHAKEIKIKDVTTSMAFSGTRFSIPIADDIDNDQAFVNFCNKSSITGYRLKLDKGSAVGIALRGR